MNRSGLSGIFVAMNRNAIRWLMVLGILSIIGILSVQVFFIRKALSQQDRELNQTITIALGAVAEKLAGYNDAELPQQSPVFRHSAAYYIVNVNGDIDPAILEQFLVAEFHSRGLNLDFEYGIYDCRSDEMVYGSLIRFGENSRIEPLVNGFPKHPGYLYYFGIHFVGRNQALSNSMGIWYFFSLILILVVFFFAYSQWIILRQKQYAEIQKDFINTMTHEFKTPLASLAMSADVILKPDIVNEPERLRKYGQIIRSQVNHLLGQVEKVLEMGGRGGEHTKLVRTEVDLESLINELVQQMEARIRCEQGVVNVRYHSSIRFIKADRLHLTNIILNLIDNALKYSGPEPKITVEVSDVPTGLELAVEDQGIGIPVEYSKRVFDRFFRVPTGNVHTIKGFGLGLYYTRNIIRSHGWKIRLVSLPGKGTRMVITVPKKKI